MKAITAALVAVLCAALGQVSLMVWGIEEIVFLRYSPSSLSLSVLLGRRLYSLYS